MIPYTIVENPYYRRLRRQCRWLVLDNTDGCVLGRFEFLSEAFVYAATAVSCPIHFAVPEPYDFVTLVA